MGVDAIFVKKDYSNERNKLFTALTRSNGWITITGLEPHAIICRKELDKVKQNNFKLKFVQPDSTETLTIYRNMTEKQHKINKLEREIEKLAKQYGITSKEILEQISTKKNE